MTPRFIVANKGMADLTYDIMKIRMNESQMNEDNENITLIDGVSHYNVPDILSERFAESIKRNTFEIEG